MNRVPNGYVKLERLSVIEYRKFLKYESAIYAAADYIQEKLIDKDIIVKTDKKNLMLRLQGRNIPHLFGLYQEGKVTDLWQSLKKHSLKFDKLYIKKDKSTFLKIEAMQSIQELFEGECRLIGNGIYQKVNFERGLRTNKLILMIGFDSDNQGIAYPKTALNIKRIKVEKGEKVKTIYTVDRSTKITCVLKALL